MYFYRMKIGFELSDSMQFFFLDWRNLRAKRASKESIKIQGSLNFYFFCMNFVQDLSKCVTFYLYCSRKLINFKTKKSTIK